MLEFTKTSLENYEVIKAFSLAYPARQCDRSAGATVMWGDYYDNYFAVFDGTITFTSNFTGGICFTYPVGRNVDGMLDEIKEYCIKKGIPMVICSVNKSEIEFITAKYPDCEVSADRDWFDYLYEKDAIMNLSGRKYATQRNHINKFKKLYDDYGFEKITNENIDEIIEFTKNFTFNSEKDSSAQTELDICLSVLENYERYGMLGGALRINGRIAGYSIGEITGDTLIVHIEKADVSYHGAYQMVTNSFLRMYADDSVKFVNREEDCGDEGLRKSKLSYNPVELIEKSTVKIKI